MTKEEYLATARTYIEVKGDNYQYVDKMYKMAGRASAGLGKEHISPVQAFRMVLNRMVEDGMICQPSDYCLLYKLDAEIPCVGFLSIQDFMDRLPKLLDKPQKPDALPTINTFKAIPLGSNNYPDWPWETLKGRSIAHSKSVCIEFLRSMSELDFCHASQKTEKTVK